MPAAVFTITMITATLLTLGAERPQRASFEEAVRNLRHPELQTRITAIRQLREAGYPEAAVPLSVVVTDVEDEAQLEAILAELGIFLNRRNETRSPTAVVVDPRNATLPERAFVVGSAALAPRVVPAEVPMALANALTDRTAQVRLAALYAFGVLAPASPGLRPSALQEAAAKVSVVLRQDEVALRQGAALVAGRAWRGCGAAAGPPPDCAAMGNALIDGMNDPDESVQLAAMDSLGALRYGPAAQALADRFEFHRRGTGAEIALNAVSRVGSPASVPLFKKLLADRRSGARQLAIEGLARAGDAGALADIRRAAGKRPAAELAVAVAYAEHRLGGGQLDPIVRGLASPKTQVLAREYLVELGTPASATLYPYLRDPDPLVRGEVAGVLGDIGGSAAVPVIEPLRRDPDPRVVDAATLAVERLRARLP
jgi:HEAT repeat protein